MDIQILRPQPFEIKEIQQLFEKTVLNNFKQENLESIIEGAYKLVDELVSLLKFDFETHGKREFFLVAKVQNKIVGTIAYGKPNPSITENLKFDFNIIPEIKAVYVLPEYQSKGIGSQLFQQILSLLKENNIDKFCLDSGFKNAQRYWTNKLGKPICTLKNYWAKDVDHMIWMKKLNELTI